MRCAAITAKIRAVFSYRQTTGWRLKTRIPAAIEDCYAALEWTAANGSELGIDTDRLAVMGASAGGGLAVSAALMARDFDGPKISLLVPLYPMLDGRNDAPSNKQIIDAR